MRSPVYPIASQPAPRRPWSLHAGLRRAACAGLLGLAGALPLAQAAPTDAGTDAVIARVQADAGARKQIAAALEASPQLRKQMAALASSGDLDTIRVVPDAEGPSQGNTRFGGGVDGRTIVLTPGLLARLRDYRGHRYESGQMLPNGTVFVLAHFARHLAAREQDQAIEARIRERVRAGLEQASAQGTDFDATPVAAEAIEQKLQAEARAMIEGWNAVVDAATQANGGTISAEQMFHLLSNLPYGDLFMRAIEPGEGKPGIRLMSNGIPVDETCIAAVAAALSKSRMYDIQ